MSTAWCETKELDTKEKARCNDKALQETASSCSLPSADKSNRAESPPKRRSLVEMSVDYHASGKWYRSNVQELLAFRKGDRFSSLPRPTGESRSSQKKKSRHHDELPKLLVARLHHKRVAPERTSFCTDVDWAFFDSKDHLGLSRSH